MSRSLPRTVGRLSFVALAAALLLAAPSPARADYACGGQTDTCQCGGNNPYPCCDNGSNCTWWAWHSACCNWGVALPGWGNANTWAQYAKGNGNFEVIGYPVPNSIATSTKGGYGHVAWVKSVSGGNITISEMNCCGTCAWGAGTKTVSASYFNSGFIIRKGQLGGECSPGQKQSKGCGNCGSQSRTCNGSGNWDGWSGCGGQGACSPGQSEKTGCGNCGQKTRSCGGSCQWGGWGGCEGQGSCAPGQTQKEACGDCGEHDRSCSGSCQWNGWSGCEGPDPGGGKLACDTGEPGVCADGLERCVKGWSTCVRTADPTDEVCDGLDNDCDGPTDEERPTTMGSTPPAYAAELTDLSYPPALPPGGSGQAWAEFKNVGTTAWKKGAIWLSAAGGATGGASELYSPGKWPAWDVAAVLQADVEPGSTARLVMPLHAPLAADAPVAAQMMLLDPDGTTIKCPSPALELSVKVVPGLVGEGAPTAAAAGQKRAEAGQSAASGAGADSQTQATEKSNLETPKSETSFKGGAAGEAVTPGDSPARSSGGCRASGGGTPAFGAALLVILAVLRVRSPRRGARSGAAE